MILIAELSIPYAASWNGRWSGENDNYTVAINVSPKRSEKLIGDYSYRWSDGWCAMVSIRKPKLREKVSNKFCGYNWMIKSILDHGQIIND